MRVIFMGTPEFALPTLRALHASDHEVVAVYTQPPRPAGRGQKDTPSPVHAYALEQGLPVFTPITLKTAEAQAEFQAFGADVAVVVAYGLLLPKPILEGTKLGCVNVHPSILPRWRGAAPIQRTIMAGDTETAIVIMQMDEGLDTGDMLLVKAYPVYESDDAGVLHDTLSVEASPLLLQALKDLENGTAQRVKQPTEGVTYAKKITKEECKIDWSKPADAIHNQIRGLSPYPGAFFEYAGEKIKIFDSAVLEKGKTLNHKPGEVATPYLDIACGTGLLTVLEVQRPGKKRMHKNDMLQGFPIPQGTVLE
jgi:methionyl-tRNA formyltransferase